MGCRERERETERERAREVGGSTTQGLWAVAHVLLTPHISGTVRHLVPSPVPLMEGG